MGCLHGAPLYSVGPWQAFPAPDPITESILVAATRVPEASMTPLSQDYVTFDTPFATTTSAIGSLPSGQSVSLPLGSDPSPALHFCIPTNEPPEVQY